MFALRNISASVGKYSRGYKKTIDQLAKQNPGMLKNSLAFVRVDFNVPLSKTDGTITDDTRIKAAVPTISFLTEQGAKVVLASHCGRPKGQFNDKMTMKPMAERLGKLLSTNVMTAPDCVGDAVSSSIAKMNGGDILMLENTRFHKEEEKNDEVFSKKLSNGASIYVNDAFGTAHRAHASTAGVAQFCDHRVAGFLMEKEIRFLASAVDAPVKPFTAVIGGAKVSTKLPVLNSLLAKCDNILIGGAMMFTFLKAMGVATGSSLVEDEFVPMVEKLLVDAKAANVNIIIPVDAVVATEMTADAAASTIDCGVSSAGVPDGSMGLDIGPKTVSLFKDALMQSKTVIWNGPMGVFEVAQFAKGTNAVANILADVTSQGGITIIGGGDSVAAVNKAGLSDKMTHISTGGGASLEMLEGKPMPGVSILDNA
mgnify:FL=1